MQYDDNLTTERSDFRYPSRMLDDRRALSRRPNSQSFARRQTAAGPLRSRRREEGAEQRCAGAPRAGSLALSRIAAGAQGRGHRQSRRSDDAAGVDAEAGEETRRRRTPGERRRPPADRLVQGARAGDGGVDGEGARHQAHGDADQRQCRRGAGGLRQPLRHQDHDLLPGGHAGSECQRDRPARRGGLSRQRPDRRLRQAGRRRQGQDRLVRHLDAEGAVPDRRQEDDGPRTGRAARLGSAGRHLLSDRRRHRPDRHVEGVRRTRSHRLHRQKAAAHGRGAGGRLRADGARLR